MSDVTLFDEIAMYIGDENANLVVGLLSRFTEVKIERRRQYFIILSRSKTTSELLDALSRSGLQNVDNKFVYLTEDFCIVVSATPIDTEMLVIIRTNGEADVRS